MRGRQRDAAIDPTRASKLLKVEARHQAPHAVADEVDATSAHMGRQEVAKGHRGPRHPVVRPILKPPNLLDACPAEVGLEREEGGTGGQVAVDQHHRALIRDARSALGAGSPKRQEEPQAAYARSSLATNAAGDWLEGSSHPWERRI